MVSDAIHPVWKKYSFYFWQKLVLEFKYFCGNSTKVDGLFKLFPNNYSNILRTDRLQVSVLVEEPRFGLSIASFQVLLSFLERACIIISIP